MKTTKRFFRPIKAFFLGLCLLLSALPGRAQTLPLRLQAGSGTLRLGMACGDESRWLDECAVTRSGTLYTIKDKIWKGGEIRLDIRPLTDTDGFIIELSGKGIPPQAQLCWAFGACDNQALPEPKDDALLPEACRDNVFSVEGNAFTVYYGEVMKLRVTQGVMPPASTVHLCDARVQDTPLGLFRSGKKTDAPVIAATCPWNAQEKLYICLYKQNEKADYNYFMLPGLFARTAGTSTTPAP